MTYEIVEKHFKHNRDWYVRKILRRAGSLENAEDIVQDAYHNALKHYATYIEGMPFNAWFYRILGNALKKFKKFERGGSCEFDEEDIAIESPDPSLTQQMFKDIESTIEKTTREDVKEVLSLYFLYGFHFREVEMISQMPYRNVVFHVSEFRKTLKKGYS